MQSRPGLNAILVIRPGYTCFVQCTNLKLLGWPTCCEKIEYTKFYNVEKCDMCNYCKLKAYVLESAFSPFLTEVFSRDRIRRCSCSQSNCKVIQFDSLITNFYKKRLFGIFSTYRNPFYTLLVSLLAERLFNVGLSSWGMESVMVLANLCKGAWVLKL